MPETLQCPLCFGSSPTDFREDHTRLVNCARCGRYALAEDVNQALVEHRISPDNRSALIAGIRSASEHINRVEVKRDSVSALISSVRAPGDPMEAGDDVLHYLRRKSTSFSTRVPIDFNYDYPLFALKNGEELAQVMAYLQAQGFVTPATGSPPEFGIAFEGFRRLREIEKAPRDSRQIFVAMAFVSSLNEAYDFGMAPAIRHHRYLPIRMDRVEHNDRIDDRIIAEIRKSVAVVADFSEIRSGVFFEAGIALGLGLPIIWTCRAPTFDVLSEHFDTRQFNHIRWTDPQDLQSSLTARLEATIPLGPLAVEV